MFGNLCGLNGQIFRLYLTLKFDIVALKSEIILLRFLNLCPQSTYSAFGIRKDILNSDKAFPGLLLYVLYKYILES